MTDKPTNSVLKFDDSDEELDGEYKPSDTAATSETAAGN